MTPARLEELKKRAEHRVEPWRPEAQDLASLRADNRELLAAVEALQAEAAPGESGYEGQQQVKERQ